MGLGIGWRCKACGAEENYCTGCGMASFDAPETRQRVVNGELGAIARALLFDSFPLRVHTIDERVFYRCPMCEELIEGLSVRFCTKGDGFDLVLHDPPKSCCGCGGEFDAVEELAPVPDDEIASYVEGVLGSGCPQCGSREVGSTLTMWD